MFAGRAFKALLFDMDGTILTSIAAAEKVWGAWAERHGLDVAHFLTTIHGKRAIDTVRGENLPGIYWTSTQAAESDEVHPKLLQAIAERWA